MRLTVREASLQLRNRCLASELLWLGCIGSLFASLPRHCVALTGVTGFFLFNTTYIRVAVRKFSNHHCKALTATLLEICTFVHTTASQACVIYEFAVKYIQSLCQTRQNAFKCSVSHQSHVPLSIRYLCNCAVAQLLNFAGMFAHEQAQLSLHTENWVSGLRCRFACAGSNLSTGNLSTI